jgi:hypothetical protein
MTLRFTIPLTLVLLAAVGVLNESITNRANAQSSPASQLSLKGTMTLAKIPSVDAMSATCFCRVTANGTEVAKPTKGGYVQPFQAEACRNYCRGLWDGNPPQRIAWAHLLSNACGDVTVQMEAALGTMGYQTVRGPEIEHGINGTHLATTCTCPSGQQVSLPFGNTKYCITSTNITIQAQNQLLQGGGYLIQSQTLYQTHGPASCVTNCQ